jgi:hypothetical protein
MKRFCQINKKKETGAPVRLGIAGAMAIAN